MTPEMNCMLPILMAVLMVVGIVAAIAAAMLAGAADARREDEGE
jgi:type II secretory pathway pseudopilin PulG